MRGNLFVFRSFFSFFCFFFFSVLCSLLFLNIYIYIRIPVAIFLSCAPFVSRRFVGKCVSREKFANFYICNFHLFQFFSFPLVRSKFKSSSSFLFFFCGEWIIQTRANFLWFLLFQMLLVIHRGAITCNWIKICFVSQCNPTAMNVSRRVDNSNTESEFLETFSFNLSIMEQ